jgi:hypothetical protein
MNLEIPPITDERLAALAARIRPVVHGAVPGSGGRPRVLEELWYIAPVDPRSVAFTWEPVPTERAERLHHLRTIHTLHTYGAPSFFKPSIAEVLAQIPADLDDSLIVAFKTEGFGDVQAIRAVPHGHAAFMAGYHIGVTTFYGTSESERDAFARMFPNLPDRFLK